jgi:deferrochelatase/peroxidase EfeB
MLNDLQANVLKGHGRRFAYHIFLQLQAPKIHDAKKWISNFATNRITSALKLRSPAHSRFCECAGSLAKVEFHFAELFPRVGFIVTNLETPSRAVVRFYNKRGTAEQWIKEGKQAVKMTRLSCHRFRSNEVRLWLSVIAYNLGNLWRRLVLPQRIEKWSLTSLQQRLVKTGGRLVKHARYYWLLLAESHLTRRLFGSMVRRIAALPVARE